MESRSPAQPGFFVGIMRRYAMNLSLELVLRFEGVEQVGEVAPAARAVTPVPGEGSPTESNFLSDLIRIDLS